MKINKHLGKMKKWIPTDLTSEGEHVLSFEVFCRYKEIKYMDLVDKKALWNKLQQNFFKIFLQQGEFNIRELGIIRIVYRLYEENGVSKLKIKSIVTDSSCKPGLIKLNQICKVYDLEGLENSEKPNK